MTTYREKLAQVVDLEAERLVSLAQEHTLGEEDLDRLETLCRCAKTLGADDQRAPDPVEEIDEATLVSLAERS